MIKQRPYTKLLALVVLVIILAVGLCTPSAQAQTNKPNILVIWGDDVGWSNVGAYNMGMMGYSTPNIDRIANEGALFTDYYAQQSCTSGRAAMKGPMRAPMLLKCSELRCASVAASSR